MKRFVSMTAGLALICLGVANASKLRLGDYCGVSEACNSGCCWQGVCRASFADCSTETQDKAVHEYERAMNDQSVSTFAKKIVAFAKNQKVESVNSQLKTLIAADIKKRLHLQELPAEEPTPAEEPAAPVEEPVAPVEEPAKPVEEPATPVEEPAKPVEEPVTPVEEPVAPVEEPVKPVEEPVTPVEEPVKPVEEPVTPVEEPVKPVANETTPAKNETTPASNETIVTPPANETETPVVPANETTKAEEETLNTDDSDTGVSFWVWLLITLGSVLVFAAGFFVVRRVFFKNDDDYTAAQAVTA